MPFILAFILVVWFETNAFAEYTDLFGVYKFVRHLKTYKTSREQGSPITYQEYIQLYHNNFFTRLITCEVCLTTWICIIAGCFISYLLIEGLGVPGLIYALMYNFALPYFTLFALRIIRKLK